MPTKAKGKTQKQTEKKAKAKGKTQTRAEKKAKMLSKLEEMKSKIRKTKERKRQQETLRAHLAIKRPPVKRQRKPPAKRHNPCSSNKARTIRAEPRCAYRKDPVTSKSIHHDHALCYGTECMSLETFDNIQYERKGRDHRGQLTLQEYLNTVDPKELGKSHDEVNEMYQAEDFHVLTERDETLANRLWDPKKQTYVDGPINVEFGGHPDLIDNPKGYYHGQMKHGLRHGLGVFTFQDGSGRIYSGEFYKGKFLREPEFITTTSPSPWTNDESEVWHDASDSGLKPVGDRLVDYIINNYRDYPR